MRKLMLLLVLAAATAGGVFGQEWYNSFAPGIEGSKFFINGGIGFGASLPYKMSIPAISASVEYALPNGMNLPLSIGGYVGFVGYEEDLAGVMKYKGTIVGIGAKVSYHFNFMQNLDPYVSLVGGYKIHSQETEKNGGDPVKVDIPGMFFGFNLGARYFFTEVIGAYVELGYSDISVFNAGLALKF